MALSDLLKNGLRDWTQRMAVDAEDRLVALRRSTNEYGVDPFGMQPDYLLSAIAPFVWLYQHYFRVEVEGLERLPPGRFIVVGNHSGQLPFDGAMIAVALLLHADPPRLVRAMVDQWVPSVPFVSTFMARCGQVVGTPENCRRLLRDEQAILVFPEGMRGITKLYRNRYQLERFGQGFLRLAFESDAPIVPVAVVGGEEQSPAFYNFRSLAKFLNLPALPLTPTLVPFPLPVKYRLAFGEPLRLQGKPDDEASLERGVQQVRSEIQTLLQRKLAERTHVFW